MKTLLLLAALAASPAVACDRYEHDGRVLVDHGTEIEITEGGKTDLYVITSAGTGTGIRVAVAEGREAMEVKQEPGVYWFGPEQFRERCQ